MNLRTDLLPRKSSRRSGLLIKKVVFGVCHDTGNPRSTAKQNVNYYKRTANEDHASAHFFVDDKEVVECIPCFTGSLEKAWHVRYQCTYDNKTYGVDANDCAIGGELCYGDGIDPAKAYDNYVEAWAFICKKYGFNPLKQLCTHSILDPKRRSDPQNAFKNDNFAGSTTFEKFQQDVVDYMAGKYNSGGNAEKREEAYFIFSNDPNTKFDGYKIKDTAYAPARLIAGKYGVTISFNSKKQLRVKGNIVEYIMDDKDNTFVPIRKLAEICDFEILHWDESTHTALLSNTVEKS